MIIRVSRTDRHGKQLAHREAARRIGRTAKYLGSKPTYYVFETPDPTSCAICIGTFGPFSLQQLDEGGPLVSVCRGCDEPAVEKRGPDRGFEPNGGYLTREEMQGAMVRVLGAERAEEERVAALEWGRGPTRAQPKAELDMAEFHMETKRRLRRDRLMPKSTGAIRK